MMYKSIAKYKLLLVVLLLVALMPLFSLPAAASQVPCYTFVENDRTVCDQLLRYWQAHGGLARFGLPISRELIEDSVMDGRTRTVQYFERAVLEQQRAGATDVRSVPLGKLFYQQRYPAVGWQPGMVAASLRLAPHGGGSSMFRNYWQTHGGAAEFGPALSDEFYEQNAQNGQTYLVQYFEQAMFEYHPNNSPAYRVLIARLGEQQFQRRYPNGEPD